MPSVFYPKQNPVLPFVFYEALGELQASDSAIEFGELIRQAYAICFKDKASAEVVEAVGLRLMREQEKEKEKAQKEVEKKRSPLQADQPREAKRKTYGGFLIDWIGELTGLQLCMFVAEFDAEKARRLYCEEDKEVVIALSELKGQYVWEKARAAHEAVLFGMGGGYKGYTQEDGVKTVNLSEQEGPMPMKELKRLGLVN